ncbi:oxidoreductase [Novosphingobium sp. KCTC 2891]|uniref:oxidoreductase n=1 Tax=Novosphingobium sp. KCTC 2891 TaxID=2989730 RepID=UPI002223E34E|nr:oxidoreductase [Novosphingobium sp. KCTC 2891]MCW1384080.1 oxidoreductase [Novosphingobium sp. KCTC 2891]
MRRDDEEAIAAMPHLDSPGWVSADDVWFVTGASRGFGRALAEDLLQRGARVVATARHPIVLSDLEELYGDRVLALRLDVTAPAEIATAVERAERHFGRIDVLVNNAGYGYLAAVEEGEEAEVRALFETNFFGLAGVTRAVLPGMRRRRRGTIVNISSGGGFVGLPGSGYYAATKFAIEGLSEALDRELEPLGLRVLIVEPGSFRTGWAGRSLRQSPVFIPDYEPTAGHRRRAVVANHGRQRGDPVLAARAIIAAVTSEHPPLRLVLGGDALANIRGKLDRVAADHRGWESCTLGTDIVEDDEAPLRRLGA